METLADKIGVAGSFLTDEGIEEALPHIFREGSYTEDCVRHASYQLRLDEVKVCSKHSDKDQTQTFEEFQQLKWQKEDSIEYVDVKPRQIALLYTKEFFNFTDNVLGFVVSRGLLFTLGLTPETTYVDPGFSGSLYVTIVNNNDNVVRLHRGMPISRLFIFKLPKRVNSTYISGSDIGIEQQLKQIPVRAFWGSEDLKRVCDKEILESIKEGCSIGDLLTQIIGRRKRGHFMHTAWLIFLSTVLLAVLFKPYIGALLGKVSFPKWLPQELVGAILPLLLASLVVWLSRCVRKYVFS